MHLPTHETGPLSSSGSLCVRSHFRLKLTGLSLRHTSCPAKMVPINPRLPLGALIEVKRSNGSWQEAVIVDVYTQGTGWTTEVTEHDYYTVKFAEGTKKKILMQQDLEQIFRPVRDLVGLVGSHVNVLGDWTPQTQTRLPRLSRRHKRARSIRRLKSSQPA